MINEIIKKLTNGGKVYLPAQKYEIDSPVIIDTPCIKLEGEVWNYSSDPNGVFESPYGTKLKLIRDDIPAICVSKKNVLGGNIIKDIGIQGNIEGMDTRGLFDFDNPVASAGICFDGKRVDQAEVSKVSCCGLASAICVTGTAEIDGCTFEKINTDGCCIGIYFAPGASYYPMFRNCIAADNPWYGFFASGEDIPMYYLDVDGFNFVRNGGGFPEKFPYPKAAACFYKVSYSSVRNCIFDLPGVFWYYENCATSNEQRQVSSNPVPALYIEGDNNKIIGNIFTNSTADSIVVNGNNNIILNNILDSNIVVKGNGNTLISNVFTSEKGKVIVEKGSSDNEFVNIHENKIVYR